MRTYRYRIVVLFFMLLLPWLVGTETVRFGAEEKWQKVKNQGIRKTTAWRGIDALVLSPINRNPYISTAPSNEHYLDAIDILLLAGSNGIENLSGLYRIKGEYEISRQITARGEASIRFGSGGMKLFPTPMAMWAAGREWGDFTLDFRLNPSNLNDGELLFLWKGRTAHGEPQRLSVRVENRRLIWDFEGFFRHGADRSLTIQLRSTPLVPKEWHHHRIRYKSDDSDSGDSGASPGFLEYLVDDVPADSVHTTAIGSESFEIFTPKIGSLSKRPLLLAPDFNGYIDEICLSSVFNTNPVPRNFFDSVSASFGAGYTDVIDSGYPGSKIMAFRTHYDDPGNSQIRFFLYATNNRDEAWHVGFPTSDNPGWVEIKPKREMDDPLTSGNWYGWEADHTISGRFFVVAYILEPDLDADISPVLSVLEVEYEQSPPSRSEMEG